MDKSETIVGDKDVGDDLSEDADNTDNADNTESVTQGCTKVVLAEEDHDNGGDVTSDKTVDVDAAGNDGICTVDNEGDGLLAAGVNSDDVSCTTANKPNINTASSCIDADADEFKPSSAAAADFVSEHVMLPVDNHQLIDDCDEGLADGRKNLSEMNTPLLLDGMINNIDTKSPTNASCDLGNNKMEYRMALQVDTSYNTGVSSDSNCSQFSASSWNSEQDTSSSLDPSPNLWNAYIDGNTGATELGVASGHGMCTSKNVYSDASEISGEENNWYDNAVPDNVNVQVEYMDYHMQTMGKPIPICHQRVVKDSSRIGTSYENKFYSYNGAINLNNGAFQTSYVDSSNDRAVLDYNSALSANVRACIEYSDGVSSSDGGGNCELCGYCSCGMYGACLEQMLPGDVYYYASNSVVLCVRQNKREKVSVSPDYRPEQVTPKLPGLNPNASVFLSSKTVPGVPDTGQWEIPADDGSSSVVNSTSSNTDYTYANGDVTADRTDAGVFSPTSESPFQSEYAPFTDNQPFNNDTGQLKDAMGNLVLDSQPSGGYPVDQQVTTPSYAGDAGAGVMPMGGVPYSTGGETGGVMGQYTGPDNGNTLAAEELVNQNSTPFDDEQLRAMLKQKLEQLFSRDNISSDSYLQSQMDGDTYIQISVVANLEPIRSLTEDIEMVRTVLRGSSVVQVDDSGEKVRTTPNRSVVILREIPEGTEQAKVEELFSGSNCPKFLQCTVAGNGSWYVHFASDQDANRAYRYLREEVRTFLGKPIMARIKAHLILRNSSDRYYNKRYQQPQPQQPQPSAAPVAPSPLLEVSPTTAPPPPQYSSSQPFVLPSVNAAPYINGQGMPFYPPSFMPQFTPAQSLMEPSVVFAVNGFQPSSVKMNGPSPLPGRTPYTNMNRTSSNRTPKMHNGQPMGRDRINSDSLPPRLQHQQHERLHGNMHNNRQQQTPRNGDVSGPSAVPNSHLQQQPYHHGGGRRVDTGVQNYHGGAGGGHHMHAHHMGGGGGAGGGHLPHHMQHNNHQHHHQQQQQQHGDGGSNGGGGPMGGRQQQQPHQGAAELPISQRYPNKSYKSRRRREEDGGPRPPRPSSSQQPPSRDTPPTTAHSRLQERFDYEPTNFPPLPGSGNNTSSGEVYESKLSDVVKGTAKGAVVKDAPLPSAAAAAAPPPQKTTPTPPPPPQKTTPAASAPPSASSHTTVCNASSSRERVEGRDSGTTTDVPPPSSAAVTSTSASVQQQQGAPASASSGASAPSSSANQSAPVREPALTAQKTSAQQSVQPPPSASSRTVTKPVPEPSSEKQSNNVPDEKASAIGSKLSYAQMLQRGKAAEASASASLDRSDGSDSDNSDSPAQAAPRTNHTLKEQGQQPAIPKTGANGRGGSGKDFPRKEYRGDQDSREYRGNDVSERRGGSDSEYRRDDYRKENDFRRDEPREQRFGNGRRMKENRERRFGDRDRDFNRRSDHRRDRDYTPRDRDFAPRERDGARTSIGK